MMPCPLLHQRTDPFHHMGAGVDTGISRATRQRALHLLQAGTQKAGGERKARSWYQQTAGERGGVTGLEGATPQGQSLRKDVQSHPGALQKIGLRLQSALRLPGRAMLMLSC